MSDVPPSGPLPTAEPPPPLNILCFDGGGVRGLSSLLVLRRIMTEISIRLGKSEADEIAPWQFFDLICGTSTGGIIALMLGRLRMTVQDAIIAYIEFAEETFAHKKTGSTARKLLGQHAPMYDHKRLEAAVKKIIKAKCRDENAKMADPNAEECRVFVLGVEQVAADSPTQRFRTYTGSADDDPTKYQIWQAARATSAAVGFFEPISFLDPKRTFIDGALGGVNNPTKEAIDEAKQIWGNREIGCLLSIGTGEGKIISMGKDDDLSESLWKLNQSCKRVANEVGSMYRRKRPNPYIRFSVDRGLDDVMMGEWEKMKEMTGITEAYLRYEDQKERATKCVNFLIARPIKEPQEQEETSLC